LPLEHSIYLPLIPKNNVVTTPTSTPTPTPTCGEAVQNGGFEQGHTIWMEESADGSDIISNNWANPYEGAWVADFANYDDADDVLTQLIYIHPNAQNDQTLVFYVYVETTDTAITETDKFVVRFLDESGTWPVSADIPIADNTTPMDWTYMPIALTGFADVRGLYLQLQFEATTDSALPTRFVLDQVSLETDCGGGIYAPSGRRWISVAE
jgi:hypothetical protein